MATRIRLRRMGSNQRPFYRVVVADQRSPRDGRFIENIGQYHPLDDPSVIEIDRERALHWLRVGAQPSNQVRNLFRKTGIWETFAAERPSAERGVKPPKTDRLVREKRSKKAAARAAEASAEPPVTDEAETADDATQPVGDDRPQTQSSDVRQAEAEEDGAGSEAS